MDINREVTPLSDYNEQKHLETVKKGEIELYENEYRLVHKTLNFPMQFMELGNLEQKMVLFFIDKDFVEPHSGKKTENDHFISFLAAFDKKEVVKKIYTTEERHLGFDREQNEITEIIKVLDPDQNSLIFKLKTQAAAIWKNNNLKLIAKPMRQIMTNSGFKEEELLEQKIMADAMSDTRDSFAMQNRRLAVDIKGLKKPIGLGSFNVYLDGGGRQANNEIVKVGGNKAMELIPKIEIVDEG